jgi:two-component system, OmpR family, alkaline phosphatase synthesis response regulator PhoP
MANILVVEDEIAIADLISMNLKLVGHNAYQIHNGNEVMNYIETHYPDLVVLDIMLPGKDGFELMKEIEPLHIPVIFLTAKETLNDRIIGLRLGADDYMVKPFEVLELLARIETVLKRYRTSGNVFNLDNLDVHIDEHVVLLNNEQIELTTKEFQLLELLILNKNIALSREKILELVWGYDYIGETRTVDVHIQRLRKKLDLNDRIITVYKIGYRLEVPR